MAFNQEKKAEPPEDDAVILRLKIPRRLFEVIETFSERHMITPESVVRIALADYFSIRRLLR